MEKLFFAYPGNEDLTEKIAKRHGSSLGAAVFRSFPDGESYVQINSDIRNKHIVLVCSLNQPDTKILSVIFFCRIAREQKCSKISLIAPYLGYMRQDKIFHKGEGLTSSYFAQLLSPLIDALHTVDPHLHRINDLKNIYTVPCFVYHAADHISKWIAENFKHALLIGPDSESEQWVSDIANKAGVPYLILNKTRMGDRNVVISLPDIEKFGGRLPLLVDDIISTGRTMSETIRHLKQRETLPPVCVGIHAVFSGSSYQDLLAAGAGQIATSTTIPHKSNCIDISDLFTLT